MTTLFVLCGLPGSGKSSIARALSALLSNAILIQSDIIRIGLFAQRTYNAAENNVVFPMIHRKIERHLSEGIDVIYDATNLKPYDRKPAKDIAAKYDAKYLAFNVYLDHSKCRERITNRVNDPNGSEATIEVFDRMADKLTPAQMVGTIPISGANVPELNARYMLSWVENDDPPYFFRYGPGVRE